MAELNTIDKVNLIAKLKTDYTITDLCRTFNIARSIYYYRINNQKYQDNSIKNNLTSGCPARDKSENLVPEKRVIELVKKYCKQYPHWGYRMVTSYLKYKHDLKVNHKRIYRIMDVLDLLQEKIKPKINYNQVSQRHELTEPTQLWEMDMVQMYIDKSGQWIYIFDIID
ncbi:MAG: IS3 family transposase, partial [Candidatus Woesearchaeota archaeon]